MKISSFASLLLLPVALAALPPATAAAPPTPRTRMTDGTLASAQAAIKAASPGDTILIPAGTWTWGAGGAGLVINKSVTVAGAGSTGTATIIKQVPDSNGLIYFAGAASAVNPVLKGLTLEQYVSRRLIVCDSLDGWRVTRCIIKGAVNGRIFDINAADGLIDQCQITMYGEQIFQYGHPDAWVTDSQAGTIHAVYIEDCTISNGTADQPYSDANAYARYVCRFNTINALLKWDQHGVMSDTPNYSGRLTESYFNKWVRVGQGAWNWSHEIRGGTGYIFFNSVVDDTFPGRGAIRLAEYGSFQIGGAFGNKWQTPTFYPINGQVGRGKIVRGVQQAEPVYLWGNRKGGDYFLGTGGVNIPMVSSASDIPSAAVAQYRAETGNPTATFTEDDEIRADRDYFAEPWVGGQQAMTSTGAPVAMFDGTTGVGIGTKAQMLAIKPTKPGIGYWVTDEGSWNAAKPANTSGRLYVWDGSSWVFKYEPFAYPHPYRANDPQPAPIVTSPTTAQALTGSNFSYRVTARYFPTRFAATGLAGTGLSLDPGTGEISGTPISAGVITATITAANSGGVSDPVTVTIPVAVPAAPTITSDSRVNAVLGDPFRYAITTRGVPSPSSYAASDLPAGLSIDSNTGVISGSATGAAGLVHATLTATNSVGSSSPFDLAITVTDPPPRPQGGALVQQANNAWLNVAPSFTIPLTAPVSSGTRLCLAIGFEGQSVAPVSCVDSRGNTGAVDANQYCGGSQSVALISIPVNTALRVGDTVTVTFNANNSMWVGYVMFTVNHTTALSSSHSRATGGNAYTSSPTASFSTSGPAVVIGVLGCSGGPSVVSADGTHIGMMTSGNGTDIAIVYKNVITPSAAAVGLTLSANANCGLIWAAYQ